VPVRYAPALRFDNIYLDDEVRIALDIRNDVLICTRDGAPRVFEAFDQ
jgi:hypothetical protein